MAYQVTLVEILKKKVTLVELPLDCSGRLRCGDSTAPRPRGMIGELDTWTRHDHVVAPRHPPPRGHASALPSSCPACSRAPFIHFGSRHEFLTATPPRAVACVPAHPSARLISLRRGPRRAGWPVLQLPARAATAATTGAPARQPLRRPALSAAAATFTGGEYLRPPRRIPPQNQPSTARAWRPSWRRGRLPPAALP